MSIKKQVREAGRHLLMFWLYALFVSLLITGAMLSLAWIAAVISVVLLAGAPLGGYIWYRRRKGAPSYG